MQLFFNLGAGVLLTFALLNLFLASRGLKNKVYLHFGIFSLFAAIYYLFLDDHVLGLLELSRNETALSISILSAALYYGAFPWFIGSYTGNPDRRIQFFISALYAAAFIWFLFDHEDYPLTGWLITSHIALLFLAGYGFYKSLNRPSKDRIFFIMIVVLGLLGIEEVVHTYTELSLPGRENVKQLPLDIYPLLFAIVMGSKLVRDAFNRYLFEHQLRHQNEKWSHLIRNMTLVVLEIDSAGLVKQPNPYFLKLTGYGLEEVIEMPFERIIGKEMKPDHILGISEANTQYKYQFLRLRDGTECLTSWLFVDIAGVDGQNRTLAIGSDISDQQKAYQELNDLRKKLEKENLALREEMIRKIEGIEIVGESPEIKYAIKRALQVGSTGSTVLLAGETGVGKELFASLIHQKSSRASRAFITVNCAALPHELIESELFGHEKGAFTGAVQTRIGRFELAHQGTLFLDEIGELPMELQPKLLRVLQDGEFERIGGQKTLKTDVRLISATNRDLLEEIKKNRFREDLYYRLCVYPITIPPLRDRKGDIPLLVSYFAERIGKRIGKQIWNISKANLETLVNYNWPGNIRELENVIERGIISSEGESLNLDILQSARSGIPAIGLDAQQKQIILATLEDCNWTINGPNGAAERLKLHPNTLRSKMKKFKIKRPKEGMVR